MDSFRSAAVQLIRAEGMLLAVLGFQPSVIAPDKFSIIIDENCLAGADGILDRGVARFMPAADQGGGDVSEFHTGQTVSPPERFRPQVPVREIFAVVEKR